jgi:hypothetical protein
LHLLHSHISDSSRPIEIVCFNRHIKKRQAALSLPFSQYLPVNEFLRNHFAILNFRSKRGQKFVARRPDLPFDRAFFRRIDLRQLDALVEQKDLQIIEQKIVRIGTRNVQAEMIDELILLLQPFFPARLTDFVINSLPELVRKRRKLHLLAFAPAARAFKFITRK